jgi:hypothetical protein
VRLVIVELLLVRLLAVLALLVLLLLLLLLLELLVLATVLVVPVPVLPLLLVAGQYAELLAALPLLARCLPSLFVLLPLPLLWLLLERPLLARGLLFQRRRGDLPAQRWRLPLARLLIPVLKAHESCFCNMESANVRTRVILCKFFLHRRSVITKLGNSAGNSPYRPCSVHGSGGVPGSNCVPGYIELRNIVGNSFNLVAIVHRVRGYDRRKPYLKEVATTCGRSEDILSCDLQSKCRRSRWKISAS